MIGKVIEGRYAGASVHKLPDKNVLYIQTEDGSKIALSKKNAISVENVTDQYPSYGTKVMMVMWNDFETSIFQIGNPVQEQPKANISMHNNTSLPSSDKKKKTQNTQNKNSPWKLLWGVVGAVCLVAVIIFVVLATKHEHTWQPATCTTAKVCSECGKTEGDLLPHAWEDATCKNPKICADCGKTEGNALEHTWMDATCDVSQTCIVCGETVGEALGHNWIEATCSEAQKCDTCGISYGDPIEHAWEWTVTSEPGYGKRGAKSGICSVCGESVEEKIDELVPEYTWNESITLEMPLETVEVGIYQDGSEYWIEFRCQNMNTDAFLTFFTNSTTNWGFTTRRVAERLSKVMGNYDDIWQKGTMVYAVMEGYGIKWTVYLQMDKNVPATVGLKVNKLNEFTAVFDGVIKE